MKVFRSTVLFLIVSFVLAGCASTKVSSRQEPATGKIARPGRILVHDFAATPGDVPAWASKGAHMQQGGHQSAEDIKAGRKLGADVARELAAKIRGMGLKAEQVANQMNPQPGDLVITGYFETMDAGNATERVAVGFGSGAAHLKTVVEGFQMTQQGLRRLGSGEVDADGGKSPGTALSVASAVATGNPIGLIVSSAVKMEGEKSGKSTIEGAGKRTAEKIAEQLQIKFREQGWIN